jgi:hypothetical protein
MTLFQVDKIVYIKTEHANRSIKMIILKTLTGKRNRLEWKPLKIKLNMWPLNKKLQRRNKIIFL